jgi:hypothetical protein
MVAMAQSDGQIELDERKTRSAGPGYLRNTEAFISSPLLR